MSQGDHIEMKWGVHFSSQRHSIAHLSYFLSLRSEHPCAHSIHHSTFLSCQICKGKGSLLPKLSTLVVIDALSLQLLDEVNGQKHLKGYALWFRCHNPCITHQTQLSLTSFQPIIIWS